RAAHRLSDRDRHLDGEILAVALEERVRPDLHDEVQVARWGAPRPTPPLPFTRTRAPSPTPAGILTVSCSRCSTVPVPPQRVQARIPCRPLPRHCAQGAGRRTVTAVLVPRSASRKSTSIGCSRSAPRVVRGGAPVAAPAR